MVNGYSLLDLVRDIGNGHLGVLSINIEKNGVRIAALQNDLQGQDDKMIDRLVDGSKIIMPGQDPTRRWTRLNIMVVSFLKFCRDVDPWSLWTSSDLIFEHYSNLNNALLDDSYPVDALTELFLSETEYVTKLAIKLDANNLDLGTKQSLFLSYISSIISKLFNSIKPPRDGANSTIPNKQLILLNIINKLNNIYFRINSPQLCSNIFKNFKPKSMFESFKRYPIHEQIEFRYLLGRYYVINFRMTNAFVQLDTAFRMLCQYMEQCPHTATREILQRNLKRILKYLIPVGITIGKKPHFQAVRGIDLDLAKSYIELSRNVNSGNFKQVNFWLASNEDELKSQNLLLPLLQKLPILVFRNLFRKVVIEYVLSAQNNKISYDLLMRALQVSIGSDQLALPPTFKVIHRPEDVENILVTLINLGFLRGNCFPALRLCVVKKTTDINDIFPEMTERIVKMFPLNNEDNWFDI